MNEYEQLIKEYSEDYCRFLESTYGAGMMSEGGSEAIDRLLSGMNLKNKHLLDIGFGLGGAAFYVAEKYQANVTGIELNPWLVKEATRRTPKHLKKRVTFIQYDKPPSLPFDDRQFDVVYSKGVLTHVREKLPLFKEIYRVLQPNGIFVLDDWLSPNQGKWSPRIQTMCEIEHLTLHAETEENYRNTLLKANFSNIQVRDENHHYAGYNQNIVTQLKDPAYSKIFLKQFDEQAWKEAIQSYQLIIDAINNDELLIRWFKAIKN